MKKMMVLVALLAAFTFAGCGGSDEDGPGDYSVKSQAKEIVKQALKTPSTAKFSDEKVLDRTEADGKKWFLVSLAVDSQNSFGAQVRNYGLVVLHYKYDQKEKEGRYYWSKDSATSLTSEAKDQDEAFVALLKVMNEWPSTATDPKSEPEGASATD